MENTADLIRDGKAVLGIEFGSTRIKSVLIDDQNRIIASGAHDWENSLSDGIWTYPLESVKAGLEEAYLTLKEDVKAKYGVTLTSLKALGISAMMHGYLAFDKDGRLLTSFRTWRNTMTGDAAAALSEALSFPIPERWTISHLYHAVLNGEAHVGAIDSVMTLSAYVHFLLTGEKVIGIGDASGMFPIDSKTKDFDEQMLEKTESLLRKNGCNLSLRKTFPKVLVAGEDAGKLTREGAALLDPEHDLKPGVPLCPPEGDAGTGMVATHSVRVRTGNVSAGTSVFAMVVLEEPLKKSYPGLIDIVTTPTGDAVAMAHANNCTGEYDKWMNLFASVLSEMGVEVNKGKLYDKILSLALKGDKDCGGILPFNYLSGESMTRVNSGRPLIVRTSDCNFTLANFMRAQLFTALGALRTGMDILFEQEKVSIDTLMGHGGFFKSAEPGLMAMASAMHTPISVQESAGEGGAWGIALLASYLVEGKGKELPAYLDEVVFAHASVTTYVPDSKDTEGFNSFFASYTNALPLERDAQRYIK